jgi:hypothetical protein
MAKLDYEFGSDGRTLILRADVPAGWRRSERQDAKTYFFGGVVRPEWQGGHIRAAISLFPRPGGLTHEWEEPPALQDHNPWKNTDGKLCYHVNPDGTRERFTDCCTVAVSGGVLVTSAELLDVSLKPPRPLNFARRNRSGYWVVERFYDEPIQGRVFNTCQVQVRLTFVPPEKPAPVYRSFWNRFLPGGRPESNRRRF